MQNPHNFSRLALASIVVRIQNVLYMENGKENLHKHWNDEVLDELRLAMRDFGLAPKLVTEPTIEDRIRKSLEEHIKCASEYEHYGNAQGAKELRAVANLLGVLLQGQEPKTVLPGSVPSGSDPAHTSKG